jgi:hypothetical protein
MVQSHGPEERCIELLMYTLVGWGLLGFEEQLNNGTMKKATITSLNEDKGTLYNCESALSDSDADFEGECAREYPLSPFDLSSRKLKDAHG